MFQGQKCCPAPQEAKSDLGRKNRGRISRYNRVAAVVGEGGFEVYRRMKKLG